MFEFATATRVIVGRGAAGRVGAVAALHGRRAMLVTGRTPARLATLQTSLEEAGVVVSVWPTAGEPYVDDITRGAAAARATACDVVVAAGGGSVLDTGKAIAALVTNGGDPLDYLEVIGAGRPLAQSPLPVVAVPTTAGTGSEVTRNAVLGSREHGVKVSLRSAYMLPRVAIVDPELTIDVPSDVTATTGLDALTQLIEAFVSTRANPMTDALCRAGIPRAAGALPRACRNGRDLDAREHMALASLWSGMALANAGLGAVHGFAGPIGGMFDAPHGALCASLLPHVMTANVAALRKAPMQEGLARFDEVAQLLTGTPEASADDGVAWVGRLCRDLKIPSLRALGVGVDDIPHIVAKARRASSMKGNPVTLTDDELSSILTGAI